MRKILCLHDSDNGRDIQVLAPILYCLKEYRDCEIIHGYIFDMYKIASIQPDLVLLANAIGSREHVAICRDCYERNIPIFSLTAEGNVPNAYIERGNDWGWNTEKVLYQDKLCFWSQRTLDLFSKFNPSIAKEQLVLTGATGFDNYVMVSAADETTQLFSNEGYDTIVGYAGWGFGKYHSKTDLEHLNKIYQDEEFDSVVNWCRTKRVEVLHILEDVISRNPDVLFILKKHPKEHAPSLTKDPDNEMADLVKYPNVKYLKGLTSTMSDLIQSCDLWTCFESTTVMEAWLLGKETVNILPHNDKRMSTPVAEGSIIVNTAQELNQIIEKVKEDKESILSNDSTIENREKIIEDAIGFDDGCNHLRALHYILKLLDSTTATAKRYVSTSSDRYYKSLKRSMLFALKIPLLNKLKIVKKHNYINRDYSESVLINNLEMFYDVCNEFYKKNNFEELLGRISESIEDETDAISISKKLK